ncbi:MAG: OmpA family protein [Sphingomonadaceae bacterium]|nr:OmpA family protein [Sphingomonadaceae bacterium]
MAVRPSLAITAGAVATVCLAILSARLTGPAMIASLEAQAEAALAEAGSGVVTAQFSGATGLPSRHPTLSGGEALDDPVRERAAQAVARIPGVGGVRWADGTAQAQAGEQPLTPLHCQDDVNALLRARTIRFDEGRSRIDAASHDLLDEVAAALRPCVGSIIAVTGHTDSRGSEAANLVLSRERADAVLAALVARGIPADGLRARGVGSSQPVEGLLPEDPANRRIEFSVVATMPLTPTPIDTPSAR